MAAPKAAQNPQNDPGFQAWFKRYNPGDWDLIDERGMSGGYNLYGAYKAGLKPDAAGHLPDHAPDGTVLKSDDDPNAITNGVDNRTGYQVAPPTYTGPMTADIKANAHKFFHAGTAFRLGGPGNWDDVPRGQKVPALTPPPDYTLDPQTPPATRLGSNRKMSQTIAPYGGMTNLAAALANGQQT